MDHLGNCIEVSYAVSDRVPDGDNRMHGWTYSYQKNRNERSGPRDKVLGLLRILEDVGSTLRPTTPCQRLKSIQERPPLILEQLVLRILKHYRWTGKNSSEHHPFRAPGRKRNMPFQFGTIPGAVLRT